MASTIFINDELLSTTSVVMPDSVRKMVCQLPAKAKHGYQGGQHGVWRRVSHDPILAAPLKVRAPRRAAAALSAQEAAWLMRHNAII